MKRESPTFKQSVRWRGSNQRKGVGGDGMRIDLDLLEQWLKMFPYGYCDGMNFHQYREIYTTTINS